MNRRLIFPLLICGLMLAGCYRQAGDSFEQVDSQNVQSIASPTVDESAPTEATVNRTEQGIDETEEAQSDSILPTKTLDPSDVDPTDVPLVSPTLGIPPTTGSVVVPTATKPVFLTPEPPPGQVEQPTIIPATATATFDIVPPTPTDIVDGPQAGDECIHEVIGGDNLFRIAINNGTTVEAIQQLNSLEGDAIQVGQLLAIPGCIAGEADEPVEDEPGIIVQPTPTSSVGGSSVATVEPADNVPTGGQQIHVVVSGDTLGGIANRYNTTIVAIIDLNQLSNPDALSVGQELLIPASN